MDSWALLCFRWSMRACAAVNVGGETLNLGEMGARVVGDSRELPDIGLESSPDRRRLRGLSGLRKSGRRAFEEGDEDIGVP